MLAFETFAVFDWYDVEDGRVAVVHAGVDYDPQPLAGQNVTLNGVPYFVRDVVLHAALPDGVDPVGDGFGLLVEQR